MYVRDSKSALFGALHDDVVALAAAALLILNLGLFWLVGRTLAPLARIEAALARIQAGDWASRLPALPGREAASMGAVLLAAGAKGIFLQHRLIERLRSGPKEE